MSKKKHIDELFKEQLQHLEATPSADVWNKIQAKMKKEKEDRKLIPIWWKLGGVAALLVLLLALNFVFQPFGGDASTELVTQDPIDNETPEDSVNPVIDNNSDDTGVTAEESVIDKSSNVTEDASSEIKPVDKSKDQLLQPSQKNQIVVASEKDSKKEQIKSKDNFQTRSEYLKKMNPAKSVDSEEAIGSTSEENKNAQKEDEARDPLIKKDLQEGAAKKGVIGIAKTSDKDGAVSDKKEEGVAVGIEKADPNIEKNVGDLPDDGSGINITQDAIAVEETPKGKEEAVSEENKKSIFDVIEENKENAATKVADRDLKNWEVTPNFGPVFYSSISGGSSIDPSFADNSQTGEVNLSYGVQVSYAINDRLSLRSGLSNVDLGYTTGGVELATAPLAIALGSIDYGGKNVVLSAFDRGTLGNLPPPSGENDPFARLNPKSTSGNAEVIQNLSYYEVPMELKYALLKKRFGVNMIGGFSTLFLGNNEVSVRDGNFRDVLGEANNLNSVSFSTNVGLGFDYKISKRLKFNVEPMFKYQLNPYSDSSVDFRPYYFGVYSGLSFKF